jgi:vacuolar protein 8
MTGIARHVRALREGNDAAKAAAALALDNLACYGDANKVAIAEAGGIPPLVELLRDGSANAKLAAADALHRLAYNDANRVLIADAGGIPPLVELMRDWCFGSPTGAQCALCILSDNNDANAVAIAAAVGFDALVELARRGRVTFKWQQLSPMLDTQLFSNAALPAKRKAALVVAELLRDFVPKSVPREIKALIGPYL